MGPDLHAAPAVVRCPACGGAVRPDAPWCGQCWAALSAPGAGAADADPSSPAGPAASSAPEARTSSPAAAGAAWPCTACGTRSPLDAAACTACGTGFLAGLRGQEEPLLVLPVVGDLGALSRAARLGLASAVVLLVALLVVLGSLLL